MQTVENTEAVADKRLGLVNFIILSINKTPKFFFLNCIISGSGQRGSWLKVEEKSIARVSEVETEKIEWRSGCAAPVSHTVLWNQVWGEILRPISEGRNGNVFSLH